VKICLGTAPRTAFSAQLRALQIEFLGKSCTPHSFRGMQVTASWATAGVASVEQSALCWSRQHSEATAHKYYNKPSHKRMASVSESALAVMREKRPRLVLDQDESYREVAPEEVDEE